VDVRDTTAEVVRTENRDGGVLLVTIDRPGVRNAVNRGVSEGVAAAMDRLDQSPDLNVAVLTGAGGTFCSGMDLKAFPVEGMPGSTRGFGGITARPPDKPVIAAVEGYALAGGFEIALAADMVVASRDAVFGLPEVQRGLIAAAGGLVRIARALPYQTATRIALLGEQVGAEELHRLGVVTRLTAPGEALAVALAMARHVSAHAPLAVAASKRLVVESSGWADAALMTTQNDLAAAILASSDAEEGARAFTEKRPPMWRGR
jgi:enoyl-CoA hydratase